MKIQKLSICNIASIEKAEIEFDKAPIASDSLFLITGDTGSGKTTILNAICLALYNNVPSFATISGSDKDPEGVKANHTSQLMRKGTGHCRVELTFLGNDNVPYLASWEVQRAHKKPGNKLQAVKRELRNLSDGTSLSREKEIREKVTQVVGLTFEQFTRTTLLAQGQFTTFLKAEDKDKSDILQKLTGTEIYETIGRKIFELYKQKEHEFNTLEATIRGANLLSAERRAELAELIDTLFARYNQAQKEYAVLDTQLAWMSLFESLRKQHRDKEEARLAAANAVETPQHAGMCASVKQWDDTASIRRLIAEEHSSRKRLEALEAELLRLGEARWHRIVEGLEWIRRRRQDLASKIAELESQVRKCEPLKPIYDKTQTISEMARAISRLNADSLRQKAEASKLMKMAAESSAAEKPLEADLKKASSDLDGKKQAIRQIEAELKQYDIPSLTREVAGLVGELSTRQEALTAVRDYRKLSLELAQAEEQLKQTREKLARTEESLRATLAELLQAERESERRSAFLSGQMELKDHIVSLRERFEHTHVCPLCGNENAQIISDETLDKKLAEARAADVEARKSVSELTRRKAELEVASSELKRLEHLHLSTVKKNADALDAAEAAAGRLAPDYADPECFNRLESAIHLSRERHRLLAGSLGEAQKKQEEFGSAVKEYERLLSLQQAAENKLRQQQATTKEHTDSAAREAQNALEAERSARETLAKINELLAPAFESKRLKATLENIGELAGQISREADDYNRDVKALDKAKADESALALQLEDCTAAIRPLTEQFGEESTTTPTQLPNLSEDIRSLSADLNNAKGGIKAERAKLADTSADIEAWFETHPVPRESIEQISLMTEARIAGMREEIKTRETALQKAENELNVIATQLKEHAEKKPEIDDEATPASLAEAKAAKGAERDEILSQKVGYETLLRNDEANTRAQESNRRRLEVLRVEKNNWQLLNSDFGSSDGSTFKKVAQSYLLRILLQKANHHLRRLSPRYRLSCEDGSLAINVIDTHMGDVVRSAGQLSGGESFVVSLALSLGLAALNKEKINIDTLFIDEGFGTLDKEVLETVIDVLDRLHAVGGRRIGIISHVQDLKERIPTQIRLERTSPSTSRVVVTTA